MSNGSLEGEKNVLVHIFYEIYILLYLINHDSKNCQEIHNIMIDSSRIHSRILMDFFVDRKKFNTDIIVKDIISNQAVKDYIFPHDKYKDVRDIINKTTAHLSFDSCDENFYSDELEEKCKQFYADLIKIGIHFAWQIDKIIKDEYKEQLMNDDVKKLINNIKAYELPTVCRNLKYFVEVEDNDETM